jgi:N-acyl-D-amino-acid deacylase
VIGRSNDTRYRKHDGQSVAKIAEAMNEDPWDTFFNLVKSGAFALPQTMTDANKILAMQQQFVSFCTDVGPAGGSRSASHPRAFGSFPRLFSRYVRDLGAISLERAVAQASAAAANNVMAYDRGRISVGLAADVIVFDYENLTDHADFKNPHAMSEGMKYVVVNGRLVLKDGEFTGARPGRVLRGPGYNQPLAAYNVSFGPQDKRFANYDSSMKEFMREHRVPGVSIAVTNHGKVVLARGYGYADIAQREQVKPHSLFRIASLSKPITAVAILQLIEQGRLKLDDNVFEVLKYEEDIQAAGEAFDIRFRKITIRHLLEHRGGWDRDKSFDAMFQSVRFAAQVGVAPPADQAAVIKAMFSNKLDFVPGERYAYSNFGYCLLGRVVEKLTDQTYEAYVKKHVLAPIGVTSMRIGATRLAGRAANEVRYYQPGTAKSVFARDLSETVPAPYGAWHLEAMDSHGAWIATATDLAKFAAAFNDADNCPILSRRSVKMMYARPPGLAGHAEDGAEKEPYYSLGWLNRTVGDGKVNHWHSGSLAGTATIMIRRHDGKNFVALVNTRVSPNAAHLGREIDGLLHKMANAVTDWPE